jgi:regulator of sigma D
MENKIIHKFVTDLGAAAYIMMHKYKVVGKKGKAIYFEVNQDEVNEFDSLQLEYLSSEFHRFDSCLMSLKKIGEYMPKEN